MKYRFGLGGGLYLFLREKDIPMKWGWEYSFLYNLENAQNVELGDDSLLKTFSTRIGVLDRNLDISKYLRNSSLPR